MTIRRTRLVTAALAAPLALALVACGSDDSDNDDADDTSSSSTTTTPAETTPAAPTTTDAPASSAPAPSAPAGDDAALLAAAETALGEVRGGTVFSIDLTSMGYDVDLVTADGTEMDVDVSADGSTVTGGPVADPDDADDADDLRERQQLLGAQVDYVAAIDAARGEVPGGAITGVDLSEDDGATEWEISFDEDTADEKTVVIDATNGSVLRTELDD